MNSLAAYTMMAAMLPVMVSYDTNKAHSIVQYVHLVDSFWLVVGEYLIF